MTLSVQFLIVYYKLGKHVASSQQASSATTDAGADAKMHSDRGALATGACLDTIGTMVNPPLNVCNLDTVYGLFSSFQDNLGKTVPER